MERTQPNLKKNNKGYCENTTKPATSFSFHNPKILVVVPVSLARSCGWFKITSPMIFKN